MGEYKYVMRGRKNVAKIGICGLFLVVNAVALFCALNPWTSAWQAQAITVLVVEAVLVGVIGLPAIIYQMVWRKKNLKAKPERYD